MTKRTISLSLIACLLLCLCGCGKEVSDYAKEHGQISLEIVDDYLNGNISNDTARTKLKLQEDLIQSNCDKVEADTGKYPHRDSIVAIKIGMCITAIISNGSGTGSKAKIKDAAKELKKEMNK